MRVAVLHLRDERPENPAFNETLAELNAATIAAAHELGWEVEVIASGDNPIETSLDAADNADVIVVMGGEDVSPELYDGPEEYEEAGRHDIEADTAHIAVIQRAAATSKPLLGICRGNQLINTAFGGTLVQHMPTTGDHRGPEGSGRGSFAPAPIELLDIADGLHADVADEPVLHSHHQAIDTLGEGLIVAARAADGTIEAVVHASAPITGVQWHPEFPDTAPTQLAALLKRLERQVSR